MTMEVQSESGLALQPTTHGGAGSGLPETDFGAI